MQKLLNWLDNHIIKLLLIGYIFIIPLYPKLPLKMVNYTYVAIRAEDVYVGFLMFIFIIQLLRKKIQLHTTYLKPFLLFWGAVFLSFFVGYFVTNTIILKHIGFLHAFRRVEYMVIFFVFLSTITSKSEVFFYLRLILFALFLVGVYGLGQKFLGWPAVQTMNPEYAKGYLLVLDANARISSTFGGHYDLAAYLVLLIPILISSFYYFKAKWWYFLILFISIFNLTLTASRVSYGAYVASTIPFLLFTRKWKMLAVVIILTIGLTLMSGNLTSRLSRTFQQKQIFIDKDSGQTTVPRRLRPDELPVGDYIPNKKIAGQQAIDLFNAQGKSTIDLSSKDVQDVLLNLHDEVKAEAKKLGKVLTLEEENRLVEEKFKNMKVIKTTLPDISFATRLQVEWPRAINAFLSNPITGRGPSTITEATDNDYLRWIGEFGILGTVSFLYIFYLLVKEFLYRALKGEKSERILYWGLLFGFGGLLINATYIDVFEASKIAYQFWMIMAIMIWKATYANKKIA